MRTNLVRIGNSRGIRIPKAIIEECRLSEAVELEIGDGCLVVRPAATPRAGWDEAFQEMATQGDDELLDHGAGEGTRWDSTEWEW
jgi:antitoxin MazE